MTRHATIILLAILLAVADMVPAFGRHAAAATIVYPDTLNLPDHRYTILPVMRPARKKVGIALSGGGANGFAQIGVLKAFEEAGIPVDYIAGTSIGALVGGLYSTGYTATELETIVNSLPIKSLLSLDNDAPRTSTYLEQKNIRDRATIAIRFDGFRLVMPKSLSAAQPLTRTVDLLVLNAPYHTTHAFSDLPINFRAVTTDLISGRRITLTSGPLSEAIRASSTVPILFQPIERGGHKLADGGLVANLPVDELEVAGATYKIAVDAHGRMYRDGDDIDIPWKAADQAMSILTQVQYPVQLDLADIVISPEIGDHKATDVSDIAQLIAAGYDKGRLLAPTISQNIRLTPERDTDIRRYVKTLTGIPGTPDFAAQTRTAGEIVRTASRLKECLRDLLATDLFSRVFARIDQKSRHVEFVATPLPLLKEVAITGGPVDAVSASAQKEAFSPIIGSPYTSAAATRSLEKLVRLYRDKGYSLVGITSTRIAHNRLTVGLSSGRIGSIGIEQDKNLTGQLPVRREIVIDTTQALRLHDVEKSVNNLYGTGVFNRVSLSTESLGPDDVRQPDHVDFRLDEKPSNVLRLGLRYDETSNAQMLIDLRNENLNGTANSLGGWAKISQKHNSLNLELSIPRIGNTPLTMYSKAFYDQRDIDTRQRTLKNEPATSSFGELYSFGIQHIGLTTAFGTMISSNGRLVADLTLQNARSYPRNAAAESVPRENLNIAGIGGRFTLDTRNSPFLPSDGRLVNIRYTASYLLDNASGNFWQFAGSHEENISLTDNTSIQFSGTAGISSPGVPFSEKYFVGGTGTSLSCRFIGLKENDLIGDNVAVVGVQFRHKPAAQVIFPTSLVFAYNAGNVWPTRRAMKIDELIQGVGAGLVWETPIGPAQLMAAKSFAFATGDVRNRADIDFSKMVFYFSLGHDF